MPKIELGANRLSRAEIAGRIDRRDVRVGRLGWRARRDGGAEREGRQGEEEGAHQSEVIFTI